MWMNYKFLLSQICYENQFNCFISNNLSGDLTNRICFENVHSKWRWFPDQFKELERTMLWISYESYEFPKGLNYLKLLRFYGPNKVWLVNNILWIVKCSMHRVFSGLIVLWTEYIFIDLIYFWFWATHILSKIRFFFSFFYRYSSIPSNLFFYCEKKKNTFAIYNRYVRQSSKMQWVNKSYVS